MSQAEQTPEPNRRDGFALAGKVAIALVVGTLLTVAVWQCHGYKSDVERLTAENTDLRSIVIDLKSKMQEIIATGTRYKAERDSAFAVSDSAVAKLSYAQKISKILQGLLANKTLTPAEVAQNPSLTDERVVTASLKTIERERILRLKGDTLYNALGALNVQILDFKTDNLMLKNGLVNIETTALGNVKGGVWPLNHKRRKQNKDIAKQAWQVLHSVIQKEKSAIAPTTPITPPKPVYDPKATSDLENALNQP